MKTERVDHSDITGATYTYVRICVHYRCSTVCTLRIHMCKACHTNITVAFMIVNGTRMAGEYRLYNNMNKDGW